MTYSQALWKTLRNPHDSIAHVAFRVLGKFGGGNRRMLKEPQKVGFWKTFYLVISISNYMYVQVLNL